MKDEISELLEEARFHIDGQVNCNTPEYAALDKLERALLLLASDVRRDRPICGSGGEHCILSRKRNSTGLTAQSQAGGKEEKEMNLPEVERIPGNRMGKHLWPHPKLAQKFEELGKKDEAIRVKLRAVEHALADLRNAFYSFAQDSADTVQVAIMQRDNAEAELAAKQKLQGETK